MISTVWAKIIYGDNNNSLIYTTNEFDDKRILINLYRHIEDIKSLSGYCETLYESIEEVIKNKKDGGIGFFTSIRAFFEIFIIKFDMLLVKINKAGIPLILKDNKYNNIHLLISKLRNLLAHRTSIDIIGHNQTDLKVNIYIRQNNFDSHIENWIKKENKKEYDGNDLQNNERVKYQGQFEKKLLEYQKETNLIIQTNELINKIDDFGINIEDVLLFLSLLMEINSIVANKFYDIWKNSNTKEKIVIIKSIEKYDIKN